jgi:putative transposase
MQLVEQHRIDRHDPRWTAIDAAAFASKNLYNAALYLTRQTYLTDHTVLSYGELDRLLQPTAEYRALPAKVAQWVLKQIRLAWTSYFPACQEWEVDPKKFQGHPKLPKYRGKQGRNLLTYTIQAISRHSKNAGWIVPSGLPVRIATKRPFDAIAQVRIVPHATHYTVEVVYDHEIKRADVDPQWVAGIDLGVNNLATLTTNQPGFTPLLVNGRPLKALNQLYNKRRAHFQALLPEGQHTSRRLDTLDDKRKRQVDSYLHVASRRMIDHLVQQRIGTLVIGKNDGWKQGVALGKRTNQSFVFLPHARFIQMLTYKAQLLGIEVILTEESYTSKCSFLDGESLGHREQYAGKRTKRGLFITATGRQINADVNASYNMIVKVVPNAFGKGREGVVVHPVRHRLANRRLASSHARRAATIMTSE